MATPAGYSGTPLPKKLGIQPGHVVALHRAPDGYLGVLGELPPDVKVRAGGSARADVVQFFATRRADLSKALASLGRSIFPDGALWISWPKKTAPKKDPALAGDLDENAIREIALPTGLVDVKVCAVDATWSGLKLVWRKEKRGAARLLRLALFAALGLAAAASSARAQSAAQAKDPDAVLKAIRDHFKEVPAEFDRYRGGAEYGEVLSRTLPTLGAKTREVALLEQAEAAGLFSKLPDEVLRLGHNVIVHDPMSAVAYVRALHAAGAPFDDRIKDFVVAESVAAGEFGEKLAVAEMDSADPARRAFWSEYLQHYALYASSRDSVTKAARRDIEPATRAALVRALAVIGSPDALPFVRELLAGEKDDAVQAAAIFAFTGLAGFDAIDELAKLKPAGKQSAEELSASRDWLRNATRADLKHGAIVNNDAEFADRFADQPDSEVMRWIGKEGLLESRPLTHPKPMRADRKRELLARLEDAKGFGLEAVKGTLFVSLEPDDETTLLRIRQVSYFSPNAQSEKRASTIGILVRTIRHGR